MRYHGSEVDMEKKVIASPVLRMASSQDESEVDLQRKKKVTASLVHRCWSLWLIIWTSISQPYSACKPIFKTHRGLWPTWLMCYGPQFKNH